MSRRSDEPKALVHARKYATHLRKALQSADAVARQEAAARFAAAPFFAGKTPQAILEIASQITQRHALGVIAAEAGFDRWADYKASLEGTASDPAEQITRVETYADLRHAAEKLNTDALGVLSRLVGEREINLMATNERLRVNMESPRYGYSEDDEFFLTCARRNAAGDVMFDAVTIEDPDDQAFEDGEADPIDADQLSTETIIWLVGKIEKWVDKSVRRLAEPRPGAVYNLMRLEDMSLRLAVVAEEDREGVLLDVLDPGDIDGAPSPCAWFRDDTEREIRDPALLKELFAAVKREGYTRDALGLTTSES